MTICPICNQELKTKQALGSHLYYNHHKTIDSQSHVLQVRLESGKIAILDLPIDISHDDVTIITGMLDAVASKRKDK